MFRKLRGYLKKRASLRASSKAAFDQHRRSDAYQQHRPKNRHR